MNSVLKWVGVTTVLAIAALGTAQAQTIEPLTDTAEFYVPSSGGWGILLSGCEINGVACSTSNPNASVTATVVGSTLSLVFTGTNGTGSNELLYNNGAGSDRDLTINVQVFAPGIETVWEGTDLISQSSTTSGAPSNVTASDTLTGQVAMISALGNSQTLATYIAPALANTTAGLDIKAGILSSTTSIPSVTLTFNAPEPVSTSLLAVGIAGIGFVRRRRRRT
jgi:hypothetical protein